MAHWRRSDHKAACRERELRGAQKKNRDQSKAPPPPPLTAPPLNPFPLLTGLCCCRRSHWAPIATPPQPGTRPWQCGVAAALGDEGDRGGVRAPSGRWWGCFGILGFGGAAETWKPFPHFRSALGGGLPCVLLPCPSPPPGLRNTRTRWVVIYPATYPSCTQYRKNGGKWGKWGKMGRNGEKWGEMRETWGVTGGGGGK